MSKLDGKSMDILEENIQQLKQLFPETITDGQVDFDMLKQVLGDYTDDTNERYNFSWNGKGQALRNSQTPSMGTLRPNKEESKDWDTTENLYIEGDNLEVLKLLQKSYFGKIKMIYIDPPYNTGGDFVYKDDFKDSLKNYKEMTGQVDGNGNATTTNREYSGRYHTDWLNMMYPRLRLARNLLTEDGVIFISIDDNEQANLKKLCDEVFGEENFATQIPWQSRLSMQNDTDLSVNHEYILVYAKCRRIENRRLKETNANTWYNKDSFAFRPMSLDMSKFDNSDNDPRGPWKADPFDAPNIRPNLTYPATNPNTGEKHLPPSGRHWRISQEKFSSALAENRIFWGKNGMGRPQMKSFYNEKKDFGTIDNSWFSGDKIGTTTAATKELQKLFKNTPFDTPKPLSLLKKNMQLAGVENSDIILDFFSGSATTAHAVMQLNAEDGGTRKFIMVQLPEETDEKSEAYKAGYTNIAEIGKERIRRAGEQIKKGLTEKHSQQNLDESPIDPQNLDIGFKVIKLDTSNIKPWNPGAYEDIQTALSDNISPYIAGRSEEDVVFELMLKMGLSLTYPIKEYPAGTSTIYSIGFGALMICLSDTITMETANKMNELYKELAPETWRVVCRDEGFASDSAKTNVKETLKSAGLSDDAFITL